MKVEMSSAGALIIKPEDNIEKHALRVWQEGGAMVIVKTGSRVFGGNIGPAYGDSTFNSDYEPKEVTRD